LATNYKPLSLVYDKYLDTLFFSSLEDFMTDVTVENFLGARERTIEVPPYSLLEINIDTRKIKCIDLKKKPSTNKALVIASSGLDSTVCASWAIDLGYETELLHFNYGCRATTREFRALSEISKFLDVPTTIINLDVFKNVIKHSRLIEGDLVKDNDGEASAELAHEWVPARNLIFMSIAAGYAEAHGFDSIILGGNLEESGAYPDNELIFQRKFEKILPHALNLNHHVSVLMPVADLMKSEIIGMGLRLGTPLHLTWSCYEDQETPCQSCGPDYMRRTGFKMHGLIDPQATDPESDFWKGCRKIELRQGKWINGEDE
jgi:7-cyano-7-deazaguanine synthase